MFRGQDTQSVLASILIAHAVICYLDKKKYFGITVGVGYWTGLLRNKLNILEDLLQTYTLKYFP